MRFTLTEGAIAEAKRRNRANVRAYSWLVIEHIGQAYYTLVHWQPWFKVDGQREVALVTRDNHVTDYRDYWTEGE